MARYGARFAGLAVALLSVVYIVSHFSELSLWWEGWPEFRWRWSAVPLSLGTLATGLVYPLLTPIAAWMAWLFGGWFVTSLFPTGFMDSPNRLLLSWTLGCGLWAITIFITFWTGLLNSSNCLYLLLFFILPGFFYIREIGTALFKLLLGVGRGGIWLFPLIFLIMVHLVASLAPVTGYDDQVYHLTIPKLMAASGTIDPLDMVPQIHKPFLGNLLYLWHALMGGNWEISCQVLHFLCGMIATLGVAVLARFLFGGGGFPAALAMLAIPQFHILSGSAYVDLMEVMFEGAFILLTLHLICGEAEKRGSLWFLSGLLASFACAVKFTFLYTLISLVAAILIYIKFHDDPDESDEGKIFLRSGSFLTGFKPTWRITVIAWFIGFSVVLLPFLVKSAVVTGNPLYPHFCSILGGSLPGSKILPPLERTVEGADHEFFKDRFGPPRELMNTLLMPVLVFCRSFIHSRQWNLEYFDGMLSPHLLFGFICLLVLRRNWQSVSAPKIILSVFLMLRFLVWMMGSQQIRFLFPISIVLAALTGGVLYGETPCGESDSEGMLRSADANAGADAEIGKSSESEVQSFRDGPIVMKGVKVLFWTILVFNSAVALTRLSGTMDLAYFFGSVSKGEVLEKRLPFMRAFGFLNADPGRVKRVRVLYEPRVFYLNTRFSWSSEIDMEIVNDIYGTDNSAAALKRILSRNITHLAIPMRGMAFLDGILDDQQYRLRLKDFLGSRCRIVYRDSWGLVLELADSSQ
ncbi:MAG: hypothetical protein CVV64_01455 [Candidatus Wallbacteria bacterium HGW-Wallbacteria-1]|uniref:Glycosyltransferase RgtA/B/C/D-like domain-containing protein n=1 Tax=Candidatus Wallbacteria bacterium HGW-Wallbacteria-1 TaxID=2013854 RepID=A0A2N1PUT9_9BACT|nr:MAG: hypothetical protein CVV64_01455 [Candidatus Wallbacteria bacterium HGW-Wallbacteria-1]